MRKIEIPKKLLIQEYIKNKKSKEQIARELKCSASTINHRLREHSIKIRNWSEARKLLNITGKNSSQFKHGRYCKNYINRCICCGKKISKQARRCEKCEDKHHANLIKGEKHRLYGKHRSEKTKKKISKTKIKRKCHKGRKNSRFGKPAPHGKRIYFNGSCMRSSYEVKFAFFLDCNKIKWIYEPKRFYFKNCTYCPDFYIPEWDLYIEIKGWFSFEAKNKFRLFKKFYPNENIKVLMKPELQELGIL